MNATRTILLGHITLSSDVVRFLGLEAQSKAEAIRAAMAKAKKENQVYGSKVIKRNQKKKVRVR